MRVLVTTLPMLSHVRALLPFVAPLAARGHEIRFAASSRIADVVQEMGFGFAAAGPGWLIGQPEVSDGTTVPDGGKAVLRNLFIDFSARRTIPDLLSLGRTWIPDIVLRGSMEHAGEIVADILGVPQIAIQHHAYYPQEWLAEQAGDVMNQLRAEHGLPDTATPFASGFRYGCFSLVPRALSHHQPLPTTWRTFRRSAEGEAAASEEARARRIHVFLGSSSHKMGAFDDYRRILESIVEAFSDARYETRVSLAVEETPERYTREGNVRVYPFDTRARGLPACDLVVCHGGMGTVREAAAAGRPMIIVPRGGDQHTVARAAETAGVALVLRPAMGITPEIFASAARAIFADSAYAARAARIQDEIRRAPSVETSTGLIEAVARDRVPVTELAR